MTIPSIIAIDGPAASGKTTLGQMLASRLNYLLLDTGSMYRAATLAVREQRLDINDEEAVTDLVRQLHIDIEPAGSHSDGRAYTVKLDGRDITWEIRSAEVDAHVSQISSYPGVRQILVERQRELARQKNIVMVGRDIGTVVLPDAPLKVYLVASAEERARRRWQERQRRGKNISYQTTLDEVLRRDAIDGGREHSPMRPADDALLVDSTDHSPEELVEEILTLLNEQAGET